jgi:hypothetical protein
MTYHSPIRRSATGGNAEHDSKASTSGGRPVSTGRRPSTRSRSARLARADVLRCSARRLPDAWRASDASRRGSLRATSGCSPQCNSGTTSAGRQSRSGSAERPPPEEVSRSERTIPEARDPQHAYRLAHTSPRDEKCFPREATAGMAGTLCQKMTQGASRSQTHECQRASGGC